MPLPRDLDQVCGEVWGKVWGHHGQRHRSTQHIALSRSFRLLLIAPASVLAALFFGSIVAPCFNNWHVLGSKALQHIASTQDSVLCV